MEKTALKKHRIEFIHRSFISILVSLLASMAWAQAEEPAFLDSIKDISLSEEPNITLSLGGEARLRWEFWNNFGFAPQHDDDFGLIRLRLHTDVQFGEVARLFVEGKGAISTDRDLPGGRRTLDEDSADLQQTFLDVNLLRDEGRKVTLRSGRQELLYGKQRLVSPLDWSNTRRTWDGFRLLSTLENWQVDTFWTRFVPVDKYDFNENDADDQFYGLYATHKDALPDMTYDVYFLARDREITERYTFGLRADGLCGTTGLDYDVEYAHQFGKQGTDDVEAWFVAAVLGYKVPNCPWKSRIALGYDFASGDRDPADTEVNTFDQLFPLGHAFLGYIDVVGRQNIHDFSQSLAMWPVEKKVMAKLDYHLFWRAEENDALYNAGGGVVRAGDTGNDQEIGSELDVTLKWVLGEHTVLVGGYSHFFAGDFIGESGPSEDIDFTYLSAQYTF